MESGRGLSLFLTLFIMSPVLEEAYDSGLKPYMEETMSFDQALANVKVPFREFMLDQTREADLVMFAELGGYDGFETDDDIPLKAMHVFLYNLIQLNVVKHNIIILIYQN